MVAIEIQSVQPASAGWTSAAMSDREITWENPTGDSLVLRYSPDPPVIGAPLAAIDTIRKATRERVAREGGGVIELESVDMQGLQVLLQILKFHRERHNTYVGSLTLPFAEFCFTIEMQCGGQRITGVREALVAEQRLGEFGFNPDGPLKGWFGDPYDADFEAPVPAGLRSVADDERYDSVVPDHPLARLRRGLRRLLEQTRLDVKLFRAAPFVGPPGATAS